MHIVTVGVGDSSEVNACTQSVGVGDSSEVNAHSNC